jgi:hypothetical protein
MRTGLETELNVLGHARSIFGADTRGDGDGGHNDAFMAKGQRLADPDIVIDDADHWPECGI